MHPWVTMATTSSSVRDDYNEQQANYKDEELKKAMREALWTFSNEMKLILETTTSSTVTTTKSTARTTESTLDNKNATATPTTT